MWISYAVATYEDIAMAVCRILSTARTRRYVVTIRGVMRVLGREIPHGALRATLDRYGFRYTRVGGDVGKYIVDAETAKLLCEKLGRRKKRVRF
jgi:hypothetical protein